MDRRGFLQTLVATAAWPALSFAADPVSGPTTVSFDLLKQQLEQAPLAMLFRGSTAEEGRTWQAEFKGKLQQLLGDSTPPERWEEIEVARDELEDHTRLDLVLRASNRRDVPVYVLIPNKPLRSLAPAVVCVHGHGHFGHDSIAGRDDLPGVSEEIEKFNYDYGRQFVRRGYVVAAPCLMPFGRRIAGVDYKKNDACGVEFTRLLTLGELSMASNLRDIRWAISALQKRSDVDGGRIGCAGLSLGGRMTMLAAAIDPRIRVAAISGALNLMQERAARLDYTCGSQVIPGLLQYGDYSEIGCLIAPRPCVWEVGVQDRLMVAGWRDVFRERLERVYAALGASDQLQFDNHPGGHRWNGEVAFPLFERVLNG